MGYNTKYEFEIISGDDGIINYERELTESTNYEELFDWSIKWYKHKEDCLKFSLLYPDLAFCITGYGEDYDDIWRQYFKNGKSFRTKAKIIFEEFDESKLV